jgi:DNA-binding GntR family transcriptional regulator
VEALLSPKSLVDQAYKVILDAVCDGTFKPGERLTQEDIASRLKVSRQPVTHALALLKAQGFLAPSGRRGLTVTSVDPAFFEAIYQFRSAVEPLAVRLATPRLVQHSILQGRFIVERGRNAVISGESRVALQSDLEFHTFICDLSGNPLIAETMRLHWQHLRRAMGEVLRHPGMSISAWQEHGRILEHMIQGDGEGAAELMRRHLVEAYERVNKV